MSACNLLISDLRLWVHLGYSAEEKYHSQLVSVNIDFTFKSPPLGLTTDRLEDTICYLEVVQSIQSLVQSKQFNLIEHLTHDIYRTINNLVMQKKLIISSIGVTIHKVAPPVPSVHGGVFFTYRNALQE
ncbi:dihydroneopterin aldolase [Wolbachia endosymbiont of Carposina sasakii]|jgi:dihydroneopterin aldolase|uniref:dihydroneopterin aldolase n=4 Tax=Wolbachia TaxID=953 RepID=A0A6I6CKB5_WOLPI|nr:MULTISPECIES: dihydroneopterin aldolase [Wolbachia]MDU8941323.1 dihydroneopterin aldolase [Wolbachia endosymbiont of Drosophila malagassya]MDX5487646.1 dihydroneopterin aldolase [Wolbachia endosymbiont of Andrena praecox]MDX5497075.1 dihydroneopterin aldolase [Wolbachia endosymbiont of Nomada fabriciana]MDX5497841.1 dihydroneopterin aldolase [Wolbachia endosymbiont of Lasioglossum nitidulum]MDX5508134.1 dihydroneopterin aldolase [Wolbachia endosymbiont of Hylaeus sinuatus]MDX5509776.1 dihy